MRRTRLALLALIAVMPPGLAGCHVAESDPAAAAYETRADMNRMTTPTPSPAELPEVGIPDGHIEAAARAISAHAIPGASYQIEVNHSRTPDVAPEVAAIPSPSDVRCIIVTHADSGRFAGDDSARSRRAARADCQLDFATAWLRGLDGGGAHYAPGVRPGSRIGA